MSGLVVGGKRIRVSGINRCGLLADRLGYSFFSNGAAVIFIGNNNGCIAKHKSPQIWVRGSNVGHTDPRWIFVANGKPG